MECGVKNEKAALAQAIGVPFIGLVDRGEAFAVILGALCARELGERAIACGDEVILVGDHSEGELAAMCTLGITGVCVPANANAAAMESALSPATKAVWVCADAVSNTVCTVRNFCNALDLWMLASVVSQDKRCCEFEGKLYHVGAVADVATGTFEDMAFVCTKDTLPYRLMQQQGTK